MYIWFSYELLQSWQIEEFTNDLERPLKVITQIDLRVLRYTII